MSVLTQAICSKGRSSAQEADDVCKGVPLVAAAGAGALRLRHGNGAHKQRLQQTGSTSCLAVCTRPVYYADHALSSVTSALPGSCRVHSAAAADKSSLATALSRASCSWICVQQNRTAWGGLYHGIQLAPEAPTRTVFDPKSVCNSSTSPAQVPHLHQVCQCTQRCRVHGLGVLFPNQLQESLLQLLHLAPGNLASLCCNAWVGFLDVGINHAHLYRTSSASVPVFCRAMMAGFSELTMAVALICKGAIDICHLQRTAAVLTNLMAAADQDKQLQHEKTMSTFGVHSTACPPEYSHPFQASSDGARPLLAAVSVVTSTLVTRPLDASKLIQQ